jgi:hypothetical protein
MWLIIDIMKHFLCGLLAEYIIYDVKINFLRCSFLLPFFISHSTLCAVPDLLPPSEILW